MAVGTVDDPCVGDEGVMDMSDGVTGVSVGDD